MWESNTVMQSSEMENDTLQELLFTKTENSDTKLTLFKERVGLFPLSDLDTGANLLLNDFVSTIQAERTQLRRVGLLPDSGDLHNKPSFSLGKLNFFDYLKSGWAKFVTVWSIICNTIVTVIMIRAIFTCACMCRDGSQTFIPVKKTLRNITIFHDKRQKEKADDEGIELESLQSKVEYIESETEMIPVFQSKIRITQLTETTNPYRIPMIRGRINDVDILIFIDTGSQVHIMNTEMAQRLNPRNMTPSTLKASGFGGHPIKFLTCGEAEVDIAQKRFPLTFHVCDKPMDAVLIGFGAFWNMEKTTIDVRRGKIIIDGTPVTLLATKNSYKQVCGMDADERDMVPLDDPHDLGPEYYVPRAGYDEMTTDQLIKALDIPWNDFSAEIQAEIKALIIRNEDVFLTGGINNLKTTTLYSPTINTGQHPPVFSKPYPLNPLHRKKTEELMQELLDAGIIEYSNSTWQSPGFILVKKDGSLRLIVDYRKLNETLDKESANLPRIAEINWYMFGNEMFSSMDAASGYYSIPINDPVSRSKLAFSIEGCHQYTFRRLPMGCSISPKSFLAVANIIKANLEPSNYINYIDDWIVASPYDPKQHIDLLEKLFERFRLGGLMLKPSKCHFFQKKVEFLGYVMSGRGMTPDEKNVEKVRSMKPPKNKKGIRGFVGLCGFWRRCILNYAHKASVLTDLLK